MKTLVVYFSASGRTAKAAGKLANLLGADAYEIRPQEPYTKADLNWMNKKSRSSVEMKDGNCRPGIMTGDIDLSKYEALCLGFPIWWYTAPRVIQTFLEAYDLSGKTIVLFATSSSSGFGKTADDLALSAPKSNIKEGSVLSGILTDGKIRALAESCKAEI